jgi:hypothetical protein
MPLFAIVSGSPRHMDGVPLSWPQASRQGIDAEPDWAWRNTVRNQLARVLVGPTAVGTSRLNGAAWLRSPTEDPWIMDQAAAASISLINRRISSSV